MDQSFEASRAASRLGRAVHRALSDSKLTPAGYRLLAYLSSGASAASALAEKLTVSRPTVTATVDWLEQRGHVVRSADPTDARRVSVELTPQGRAALRQADELVRARLQEIVALLTPEEARTVWSALALLHDALDRDRERRDAGGGTSAS